MFKKKSVNDNGLKDSLLEGGGLNADALKALNTGINESDPDFTRQTTKSRKSMNSDQTYIDGLKQFDKHRDMFKDLTKRSYIDTEYDVVSMIITYDSKHALAIVSKSDEEFMVQEYSLDTSERKFSHTYKGRYLKMNLIEQTLKGDMFAICYQDNGAFFVSFLDNQGNELDQLDVSAKLELNDASKPITGFAEPIITCAFVENDQVFV
jgi:hypothetical protein